MKKTPIFPLNLVVFPNSKYPLHIFEERYKKLVRKCLNEDSGFIIVLSLDNIVHNLGVYVKIDYVIKEYESGEFDIIVKGLKRYLIDKISLHSDGYYEAKTEDYYDEYSETDINLANEVLEKFKNILNKINFSLDDYYWDKIKNSELKSFKVAEKCGLTLEMQQELLTIKNENQRMKYLLNYFKELDNYISDSEFKKQITLNDGFLN